MTDTMDLMQEVMRIGQSLATIAERQEQRHVTMLEKLENIEHGMHGNGEPGLFSRVEGIEKKLNRAQWIAVGGGAALAFVFGGGPGWVYAMLKAALLHGPQ